MFWIFMFSILLIFVMILLVFVMQIPAYWLIAVAIRKDSPLLMGIAWIVAFAPLIPLIWWAIANR